MIDNNQFFNLLKRKYDVDKEKIKDIFGVEFQKMYDDIMTGRIFESLEEVAF